jgi:hypothetical protein
MIKYVEKSFNVFKFQHPLLHDLRFQKEKEKERPKLDKGLPKQKDLDQTPATTPSLTHYYIFISGGSVCCFVTRALFWPNPGRNT